MQTSGSGTDKSGSGSVSGSGSDEAKSGSGFDSGATLTNICVLCCDICV